MKKLNVGVITGSKSDMPIVEKVTAMLSEIGLSYEVLVASAHRTPEKVITFAKSSEKKYDVIIAIAGMAAALPAILAAQIIGLSEPKIKQKLKILKKIK